MGWTCINLDRAKAHREHLFFVHSECPDVAVADWSICNMEDPGSTEDGLLTIRRDIPLKFEWLMSDTWVSVPVFSKRNDIKSYVCANAKNVAYVLPHLATRQFVIIIPEELRLFAQYGKTIDV
jgi:hypothetical protein